MAPDLDLLLPQDFEKLMLVPCPETCGFSAKPYNLCEVASTMRAMVETNLVVPGNRIELISGNTGQTGNGKQQLKYCTLLKMITALPLHL